MNRNIAFAIGIACGLLARPALAIVDGPSPGAVSAGTLKLPDKPGSIKGLSDDASVQVFSGHISYSVPFDLPQGRAGFGPQLSLSYSGELGNGPLGIGWSLGLIYIKRTLRHGVPTYTDADELELVGIGGGGRLVPAGNSLPNRYWVEGQGKTVKVDRQGNLFIVTDGSGTVYVLGGTTNSKQGDDLRTSAWFVDLISNIAGEQILIDYEQDQGQIYFHEIGWGPKQTGSCPGPSFRLTGHTEARPDVAISWASGIEVRTAKRFNYFEVHSFCETLRTYELTYNTTVDSYKTDPRLSRLAKVHMTGRGGQGALPDLKFGYADPEPAAAKQMDNVAGWQLNQRGTSIADVDGDGVGDLLRLELGSHQYKKNIGGAYADARSLTGAGSAELESSRLMDVDGDARAELVYIVDDTWRVYRLQGEKWVPAIDGAWPGTKMVPLSGPDTVFADINGDGSTDVIQSAATGIRIRFGSKTGLGDAVTLPRISAEDSTVDPGRSDVQFVDMNGDGLADVVYLTDQWAKIWLGRGDGTFVYFNRVAYPWTSSVLDLSGIRIVDMDRDGIPDLVRISAGNVSYYPGLPDGTFWPVGRMVARPAGDAVDSVVTIADANGNGSQDIVWSTPDGMWVLDMAGPTSAGMLTTIDNGLGKTTTFQYQGSGVLAIMDENAGNPWTYKLPISVPVPIYATIDPGAGGVLRVVRYGVRDGFWDGDERRFGGFLIGGKTVPAQTAAQTYYEETRFYAGTGEDRVLRGKPYLVEQQDGAKNVFTRKKFAVEARPVAGLPANPLTKKPATTVEDDYNLEGVSKPIETFTTYEYDDQVRLTQEHHAGRLDMTGDEKEVRRIYADSDFYWVRDKVCQEEVWEGDSSTLVSRTLHLYGDGQTPATAETGQPCGVGRGWLIDTYGYLASPADPSPPLSWHETPHNVLLTEHHYDSYGNVIYSKEGGVVRTLGYDSTNLHPTSETVSPDGTATLSWGMTWDNALGLPKTLTDPNQVSTTVNYDELGRYIGAKIGSNSQHVRYVYDWAAPMPRTTTYVYDGALNTIPTADPTQDWVNAVGWRQTTMVANGAGEDLFSATRLASQQWIVTDWKERDSRGNVVKHGDAFYWTGSDPRLATPPLVDATDPNYFRYQTLKYDALGRLIEQDLPNGATKTVSFKAFEQTVTASELSPVRSVLDGFGRVTHTERKVSGVVESVDAVYDADDHIRTMSLQDNKVVHEYRYDTLGRMAWANDPDIGVRELRHSDEGFLIRHKNGAGDVLGFVYDQVGRLTGRGTFAHVPNAPDPFADQAASPYVPPAWTSAYTYAYDKKATEVSACSAAHTAGRLAAVDEPAGSGSGVGRVAFCYDELGRQNAVIRSINGGAAQAWSIDKQGASGMLLSKEADDGFKLYTGYDRAGRLQSLDDDLTAPGDIWHAGANAVPDAVTGLDSAGRVLNETYGNGLVQSYQRDKLGLPADIQIAKPPASSIFHVTVPNDGGRTLYGAPRRLVDGVPGGLDHSATYDYDGAARLVNAEMGQDSATQWSFRFQYDGLQNMTGRTQKGPNPAGIGILTGYYRYGESINGKTYGPRQLTSISSEDCSANGQSSTAQNTQALATYDYDGAGRMVSGDKRTLTYDGYDQLLRVDEVGKSPLVQYAYGYDGVRIYAKPGSQNPQYWFDESYTSAPDGSRWNYVSVGERLVARLNFPAQSVPFHDPVGVGAVPHVLTWSSSQAPRIYSVVVSLACLVLLGLVLIRRQRAAWIAVSATASAWALLLTLGSCDSVEKKRSFLETTQERLYYHQGIAAGPVMTTKPSGAVDEERRYEPFGQVIDAWGANMSIPASFAHQPFNNLNKETDVQTKWSYHGARWMMPQTARWTAPDPAVKGPDGKFMFAPWGMNPYAYVKQSPTQYWDPDGQCEASVGAGVNCVAGALRLDTEINEGISIAYQQGNYGAVAGGAVLKVMNSVNIIVGSTLQGIIGLGNGYYNGISGMMEGDYERAQLGFAEAVASGLNAKMMMPENVKPNAAPKPTPTSKAAQAPSAKPDPHAGRTLNDPLPRNPARPSKADPHAPDPKAEGPHTVVGTRTQPKKSPAPYRTGITYDEAGNPVGKTDVTSHGRGDHTDPHFHPYDPAKDDFGPQQPMPSR